VASDTLTALVLQNPFASDKDAWSGAANRLLSLESSLGAKSTSFELVLAHTYAQAMLLGKPVEQGSLLRATSERTFTGFGYSKSDVIRLLTAARRCHRALDDMAGASPSLQRVRAAAWSASFGQSLAHALRLGRVIREHDVLITGETGTGKEAVARAIATGTLGPAGGAEAPFAALNIAAIPETLIESELFGHVKGAFTGAQRARVGHIRSVASGCLFLDEVGDLPATAQSKLLRVMETDRVTPLGSDETHDADVRYLAATHKDLRQMVERGTFREDLYERLAGNVIRLPALRERPEDLLPIGVIFTQRYLSDGALEWKRVKRFLSSHEARTHRWPGNVRELQNCLRNVLLGLDPGMTELASDPTLNSATAPSSAGAVPAALSDGRAPWHEMEAWYLQRVLERNEHNYAQAARVLGLDRATVRRKARTFSS
jgi:DNA-binding NtrC family response regulator